jgi:leader peptidase (prepilin peptidase)/N-methyltransferase
MHLEHIVYTLFFFALGACVGSFINVIVWRVPRGESIVSPPSACPKCKTRLAWFDNIPVFGWIALGGKCRYCKQPISSRYPIIEAIAGILFAGFYVAFFIYQMGPVSPTRAMMLDQDWPIFGLYLFMIGTLLASSLIDAEHFIIPIEMCWLLFGLAVVVHAVVDMPRSPGALNAPPPIAAMAAGAGVGLLISILLLRKKIIPQSFAEGGPLMEIEKAQIAKQAEEARRAGREPDEMPIVEFTRSQLRVEMQKEMLFLLPPLVLGGLWMLLCLKVPAIAQPWSKLTNYFWLSGFLGALWGGLVGAFTIWFVRITGTLAFGREAMGLGDVHLMLGIGAVLGAAGATFVFFLAPFVGILFAIYKLIARQGRELPYGPFLSVAAGAVLLLYRPMIEYFTPAMHGLAEFMSQKIGGG